MSDTVGRCIALATLLVASVTPGARGQGVGTLTDTTRHAPLFRSSDAWIAGAFVVGTAAMIPLDQLIAKELQRPGTQASRATKRAADLFNTLGDPHVLLLSAGVYGIGRLAHIETMADIGLHTVESLLASGAITTVLKRVAGRQRPFQAGVDDADDFAFWSGDTSFPSGHATAAFAAATAITLETSRVWPRAVKFVAPVAYGGATVVGLARLYSNAHWASDIVMGAGIGTLTTLKVIRFNHTRPRHRLDRWLLGAAPSVAPTSGDDPGVLLSWSIATDFGGPR